MKYELLESANCASTDPEKFFAEKGMWRDTKLAKEVCKRCLVLDDCLQYGLDNPELDGVLGGTTAKERQKMRRTGA